jgi:hypothetical protein
MRTGINAMRSNLRLIFLMLGALTALVVAIGGPALWLLIRLASKAGAIG